jgi:hypothetical protein
VRRPRPQDPAPGLRDPPGRRSCSRSPRQ